MPKIYIKCKSVLLKKSLELFLGDSISNYETCELVITDYAVKTKKPVIVIGKDLVKPFSREMLMQKINAKIPPLERTAGLEQKIQAIIEEFTAKLTGAIRARDER